MRVLTDFHHGGLLHSFILLFENRLGGEVYRPIGMEWYEKKFWDVFPHIDTARQFLEIGNTPRDGTPPLNDVKHRINDVYYCQDIDSGFKNKGITFDSFMSNHFDFVIASIPNHLPLFRRLVNEHPSRPKLIYQIGNMWNLPPEHLQMVDAILCSAQVDIENFKNIPYVIYHQEFDLNVFNYSPARNTKLITSFINCYGHQEHYQHDWLLFQKVERLLSGWTFFSFGGSCRDGNAHGTYEVSTGINNSRFIWHLKKGGDGYGHVIHNAFAMGRPPIVKMEYYKGKLAGQLMEDGKTCIAVDGLSPEAIKNKILFYNQTNEYNILSQNAYNRFNDVVNFGIEAEKIQKMLERIV